MWEVIRNPNFKLNDPDSGPPYYVCKGETCYPANTKEEAENLCENLNCNPNFILNISPALKPEPRPKPKPKDTEPEGPEPEGPTL